jgi:hypothetical protein
MWCLGTLVPPYKEVVPLSPVFVYIFICLYCFIAKLILIY